MARPKNIVRELVSKNSGDAARRLIALALDDGDLRIATTAIRQLALHVGGRSKQTSAAKESPAKTAHLEKMHAELRAHVEASAFQRASLQLNLDQKLEESRRLEELSRAHIEKPAEQIDVKAATVPEVVEAPVKPEASPRDRCGACLHFRIDHESGGQCRFCSHCHLFELMEDIEVIKEAAKAALPVRHGPRW